MTGTLVPLSRRLTLGAAAAIVLLVRVTISSTWLENRSSQAAFLILRPCKKSVESQF